jgi:hypothetical protein
MRMPQSAFLFSFLVVMVSSVARAQDPLDELYGHAVHSFFRGDYIQSEEILNEVINAGSQDPRAHYFRGLCQVRSSGSTGVGNADFERGAQLEIDGKKVVNVGKALERIQGSARLEIEKARAKARLASRARFLELQRTRYEEMQRSGSGLVVPPRNNDPAPIPNAQAPNDPFSSDAGMAKGKPAPMKGTPKPSEELPPTETTESEDVFKDDSMAEPPGTAPADDSDPFANP